MSDFVFDDVADPQKQAGSPAPGLGQRDPDAFVKDIPSTVQPWRVDVQPREDFVFDAFNERQLAVLNMREAMSGVDPRNVAQALEVARRSGINPAIAMTDPAVFKQELEKTADYEALKKAPATTSYLDSPEHMGVSQGEIQPLSKIERLQAALAYAGASREMSARRGKEALADFLDLPAKDPGVGLFHAMGGSLIEAMKRYGRNIANFGYEGGRTLQREVTGALTGLGYTQEQVTDYLEKGAALPKLGKYAGELPWWLRQSAYRPEQGDRMTGDAEVDILNGWGFPRIFYRLGKELEVSNKTDLVPDNFMGRLLQRDTEFMQKVRAKGGIYRLGSDVMQGIASMANTMVWALMGMPAVGIGTMYMDIAGGDLEQAREQKANPDVAWRAANWNALIQSPMEALSLAKAMKVWKPQSLLGTRMKDAFESALTEGVTEGLQYLPEKLSEVYRKSDAQSILEVKGFWEEVFTREFLKESSYSAAVGALSAGIIGGAKVGYHAVFTRNRENAAQDPVNALAAQVELLDATKSSDTAMRAFTQQLIDAGKLPEKVFVKASEVAAVFQDEALPDKLNGVLAKLGVSEEEFRQTLAHDGDLHIDGAALGPVLADGDAKLIANLLMLNPVEREAMERVERIAQRMQAEGTDIEAATVADVENSRAAHLFSTPLVENNLYREKLKADLIAARFPAHKAEQIATLVDANAHIWAAIPGESIESYYATFGYKIQRTNFGKMLKAVYDQHGQSLGVASEGEFNARYSQDQGFRDSVHQLLEFPVEDQAQAVLNDLQTKHVKNPLVVGQIPDITLPSDLYNAALAATGGHESLAAVAGQGVEAITNVLGSLGYDGLRFTDQSGVERLMALRPAPQPRTMTAQAQDVNFQGEAIHEVVQERTATGMHDVMTTLATGRRKQLEIEPGTIESVDVAEALRRGLISQEEAALYDSMLAVFPETFRRHFEIRFSDGKLVDGEGNEITSAYGVHKMGSTLEDAKHVLTLFKGGRSVEAIEAFGRFVHARALGKNDAKVAKAEFHAYIKNAQARTAEILEELKKDPANKGVAQAALKDKAVEIAAVEGWHKFDKNLDLQAWFGRQFAEWWMHGNAERPRQGLLDRLGSVLAGKTTEGLEKVFRRVMAALKRFGDRLFGTMSISPEMEMLIGDIVTSGRDINEKHFFSDADFAAKYILGVAANEQQVRGQGFSENSKTGISYDPGNLCPKRDAFVAYILEEMQRNGWSHSDLINTDLIAKLYDSALEKGIEVPCSYCYVEEARLKAIHFQQQGKPISGVRFAMAKETVRAVPYVDWLLKASQDKIDFMNQRGGLRMFSFSDYIRDAHYGQIVTLLTHAQQRGLSVKAITKQPTFVHDFAKTGININVSIDALDLGMGMDWDTAIRLADLYPNVHIRTVGRNIDEVDRWSRMRYRIVGGKVEILDAWDTHSPAGNDQRNLPSKRREDYEARLAEGGWKRMVTVITPYHHDSPHPVPDLFEDMAFDYKPLVAYYRTNKDAFEHSCCQAGGKCYSEKLQKQCIGNCGLGAGQTSIPNTVGLSPVPDMGPFFQGGDIDSKFERVHALAQQALAGLSDKARWAVEAWNRANWDTGKLGMALEGKGDQELRAEIEAAFAPVREALRQEFGDTVPLYRGQVTVPDGGGDAGRTIFSWTSDLGMAQRFGQGGPKPKPITDESIAAALKEYKETGQTTFQGNTYKDAGNGYYEIFDRDGNIITDGDDLEADFRSDQEWRQRTIDDIEARGRVLKDDVPVDQILFMPDSALQKEFIARWNPLTQGNPQILFQGGDLAESMVDVRDAKAQQWMRLGVQPWMTEAEVSQSIGSADTSLKQVAATFASRGIAWVPGSLNLDLGGGKFDLGSNYLGSLGVRSLVYDPFNRSMAHNLMVAREIAGRAPDTVTVNNVLNVIAEPEARASVIRQAAEAVRQGGKVYFLIYEGDGKGEGRETSKGWQNNARTRAYIPEIQAAFNTVRRSGNLIIAEDPVQAMVEQPLFQGAEVAPAFYSRLQAWFESKLPAQLPAAQLLRDIEAWEKKAPGFSPSTDGKGRTIPGPLAEELRWSFIKDWLAKKADAKVSKEDVLQYLRENQVEVHIRTLADVVDHYGPKEDWRISYNEDTEMFDVIDVNGDKIVSRETELEAKAFIQDEPDPARYGPNGEHGQNLHTPGGSNYREILFTLPVKSDILVRQRDTGAWEVYDSEGPLKAFRKDSEVQARAYAKEQALLRATKSGSVYTTSHFSGPNIFAHARVQDFMHPELGKVLLVEEMQSDWAAAGKKDGFKNQITASDLEAKENEDGNFDVYLKGAEKPEYYNVMQPTAQEAINDVLLDIRAQGQPAAPFVMTGQWMRHVARQMIREAASKGYGAVAWTTGQQQVDRYSLSRAVSEITSVGRTDAATRQPSGKSVAMTLVDGGTITLGVGQDGVVDNVREAKFAQMKGKHLSDVVGKGMAEKLINEPGQTISGEGLKIGGESKLNLYDKQLPSVFQAVGKQWGLKVQPISLHTGQSNRLGGPGIGWHMSVNMRPEGDLFTVRDAEDNALFGPVSSREEARAWMEQNNPVNTLGMHGFVVTPQMRQDVLQTGQPLFQADNLPKGATLFARDHQAVIHFFESSNISTGGHEVYHVFRRVLQAMAEHPNAPEWVRDDWARACAFVGARAGERWTKAQEEKFAQAGETYLAEGRAPSVELRGVFSQFRRWLLKIYESLLSMPVRISPEMRGVFDRMLATQQQIEEAAAKMDVAPMIDSQLLSDEDAVAYVKAAREAKLASEEDVIRRMEAERKKLRPGWEKTAKEFADSDPAQRLMAAIVDGGGINAQALRDAGISEEDIKRLRDKRPGAKLVTEGEGAKADQLSMDYGYESIGEMVADLLKQPAKLALIDAKAAELESEWRETWDPEIAVLSDRYEALLDKEAEILAKSTKGKPVKGEAIKTLVRRVTGQTRLERIGVSDMEALKSVIRREAAAARRAYSAGKYEEAALAKDRQRRALAELKSKYEAKIEVTKILAQIKKLAKSKTIRGEYYDQLIGLMQRLGMTTPSQKPSDPNLPTLAQFLATTHKRYDAQYDIDGNGEKTGPADIPIADWIYTEQIPVEKLTLDQLREAKMALDWLAHTGRNVGKLITKGKAKDARAVAEEFKANVKDMHKVRRLSNREKQTVLGRMVDFTRGFVADMRMVEFLVKMADGFKTGAASIHGTLRDALIQPLIDARSAEKRAWEELGAKLEKVVVELPKDRFAIDEVKLPEDVNRAWEGLWDYEKIFMVALNMGNPGNLKAIKRGYAWTNEAGEQVEWTDEDLRKITQRLTPEMWDSIEGIWRLVDSVFPMVNQTYFEINGTHLKKVQATPFRNAQGRMVRGGYYPLIFDGQFSRTAARNEERDIMNSKEAVYQTQNPRSGMTNERKGGTLPPKLSLSTLYKHLWDSIHFATHATACRDAWVLINDDVFRETWVDAFGEQAYDALTPWIRYVARPEREHADQFDSFLDRLRTKSTIVTLGLNMRTAVTQVNSILNAMQEIGVANALKGVGYMLSRRSAGYDQIDEWSTYMKHRSETMDVDMKRVLMQRMPDGQYLKTPWGKVDMHDFHQFCFWSLKAVDGAMARASWMGAYQKALGELKAEGVTDAHEQAVQYADDVVRQTQGSSDPMDLAGWMRSDSGWKKMFGMFMTFTMRFANRQSYYIRGLREGKISGKDFAKHFFLEWVMPPVVTDLVLAALVSGALPDYEERPGDALANILGYWVSGVPVLRNLGGLWQFAGRKISDTPALNGLNAWGSFSYNTVTGIHDILAGDIDDKQFKRWARSFVESVAFGFGIPYNWAYTAWDGVNDWIEGDTSNPLRVILKDPTRPKQ